MGCLLVLALPSPLLWGTFGMLSLPLSRPSAPWALGQLAGQPHTCFVWEARPAAHVYLLGGLSGEAWLLPSPPGLGPPMTHHLDEAPATHWQPGLTGQPTAEQPCKAAERRRTSCWFGFTDDTFPFTQFPPHKLDLKSTLTQLKYSEYQTGRLTGQT